MSSQSNQHDVTRIQGSSNVTGEATRIVSSPPVPQVTLVCQTGRLAGMEYTCTSDEVVLGRAAENPVSIADQYVSSKHAVLRKTAHGWSISDLKSGNGTRVNGKLIIEDAPLLDGDVICLGQIELRFQLGNAACSNRGKNEGTVVMPSQRTPVQAARSGALASSPPTRGRKLLRPQKRKRFFIIITSVMVFFIVVAAWKTVRDNRTTTVAIQLQKQKAHQTAMAKMFEEAKDFVRSNKWTEAKKKLLEMQQADNEYEPTRVAAYLKRAAEEMRAREQLTVVSEAIQSGKIASAFQTLAGVQTTTQVDLLEQLKASLNARIAKRLDEALELASFSQDADKMERLKTIAADILIAQPKNRIAKELQMRAHAALQKLQNTPKEKKKLTAPPPKRPWIRAQRRFKSGNVQGALSMAQACANQFARCRKLSAQIRDFQLKHRHLDELDEAELMNLYVLDRKISGNKSSRMSKGIRTRLVSQSFEQALQAKANGQWNRAINLARKVLKVDSKHNGARDLMSAALLQAREIYLRGYQLKDTQPDTAASLFKDVIHMTPPNNEYHLKAQKRLAEIQKP